MRIAYVGPFLTAQESPGLQRVIGVTRALMHAGHEVVVAGQGSRTVSIGGVIVHGFGEMPASRAVALSAFEYGVGKWLASRGPQPDLVMTYGGTGPFQSSVRRWAKRSGAPRVLDSVEWYDRRHLPGGSWGIRAIDNEISMRWSYPRYDGVIAISRLLQRHYDSTCSHVLRVPPLMDVMARQVGAKRSSGPLVMVYAGSPGRKDRLGAIVHALRMVDPDGQRIRLDVLGTRAEDAFGLPDMPPDIPAGVRFLGRVGREQVLAMVASADYVPLLRPPERYANAGFPTKVVEAMAVGTPVIANLTSDLADHIRPGESGLVSRTADAEGFAEALERAVRGGRQLSRTMAAGARSEAARAFDFRKHSERLSEFVEAVRG